ncbi:MAG: thiamine phosphate synthase [Brevundimonas sp.]|uniref:thiamine phosphate synthase n=1 Tax=Brevundimonas sp. TaxID=1871086 RepID=UPI00391A1BC0
MVLSEEATRLWETAKALNRAAARVSPSAARLPPLLFVTDPDRTPRPWEIAARLPPGAAVIHRGFGRAEAEADARRLRAVTLEGQVRLLIGLDIALAVAVGADGVHLPERTLHRAGEARAAGLALVTGAAHSPEALDRAADTGLDAAVLSPVFPTASPSGGEALGSERFGAMISGARLPVLALGGIHAANVRMLASSGAAGLCAVDGIVRAFAPESA